MCIKSFEDLFTNFQTKISSFSPPWSVFPTQGFLSCHKHTFQSHWCTNPCGSWEAKCWSSFHFPFSNSYLAASSRVLPSLASLFQYLTSSFMISSLMRPEPQINLSCERWLSLLSTRSSNRSDTLSVRVFTNLGRVDRVLIYTSYSFTYLTASFSLLLRLSLVSRSTRGEASK